MAEGPLTARFVLGVQAPFSRGVGVSLYLILLASMMILVKLMRSWFGEQMPVMMCLPLLALPSLMAGPTRLVARALSITLELDDEELRVLPCGPFRRPRTFRLDQIAHVELWQLEEPQPGMSRCLHLKLTDGTDAFVGPWYGTDHCRTPQRLLRVTVPWGLGAWRHRHGSFKRR